jgi:hypothetical protein
MLGAGFYPITLAEMEEYSVEADQWLSEEEHESLKEFLAFHPESGELVAGTNAIRLLRWPPKRAPGGQSYRVVYFFWDLNMPLYLLAIYRKGERIDLSEGRRQQLANMIAELIAEHSSKLRANIIRHNNGG